MLSFPAHRKIWNEVVAIIRLSLPVAAVQYVSVFIEIIAFVFCSHLSDDILLDGAALAISVYLSIGLSVAIGLGTACDTVFSQSLGSNGRREHNLGVLLQKSLLISALTSVICICVYINAETLLILAGQDPRVSWVAARYLMLLIPGTIAYFLAVPLTKYLQCQGIVIPNVVIGIISAVISIPLHYLLMFKVGLQLSTDGSALAMSISYIFFFFSTIVYIIVSKSYEQTWTGWSKECLLEWWSFFKLAFAGILMNCFEVWFFQLGTLLSGLIGTTQLGAQAILMQMDGLWAQIPRGMQISAALYAGQHLGAGDWEKALRGIKICFALIALISLIPIGLCLGLRYELPLLITNVKPIAQMAGDHLPILALYVTFDGIASTCKGALCAVGRQSIGAVVLGICYYLIALPISVCLMFLTPLGITGFWCGLSVSIFFEMVVLLVFVAKINWELEAQRAAERVGILDVCRKLSLRNDSLKVKVTTSKGYSTIQEDSSSSSPSPLNSLSMDAESEDSLSTMTSSLPKGMNLLHKRLAVVLFTAIILIFSIILKIYV